MSETKPFESIISAIVEWIYESHEIQFLDVPGQTAQDFSDQTETPIALCAAFLTMLAGAKHPIFEQAKRFLARMAESGEWADVARFFLEGVSIVSKEIGESCIKNPDFEGHLKRLAEWLANKENLKNKDETAEKFWTVFSPEACGILRNREQRLHALRNKRTVSITKPNPTPINNPARDILFTANVLLTLPQTSKYRGGQYPDSELSKGLEEIEKESQLYWYDHPIQIGVEPDQNEILYGLRGLEEAIEFERNLGKMPNDVNLNCVLSVSVTHQGLHKIAKGYLENELRRSEILNNTHVYVFTEADTVQIIDEVLAPAAGYFCNIENPGESFSVFGVDGEYGRHYSFLKAIAAFWRTFIQPEVRATFKIDLDQVFPQKELVEESGASAWEHFKTPLWGALGLDSNGHPVELGMIAGALVNDRDIKKSLFTPDVPFPELDLLPDEYVFFSQLPQALSTEAEMMTRYTAGGIDGQKKCLQRIHVTGGTNGILVDSLFRYRPFTPSFIGRAEDQAYLLSVLTNPGVKLGYLHKDGLIMRHDKEAFAQEAIQSAFVGKVIGDYLRIIIFSGYARTLTEDIVKLKDEIDPFTGCFVSLIPTTVAYLRFCLKATSFFSSGKEQQGNEFLREGARRIRQALKYVNGEENMLKNTYEKERFGWNLFYDTLSAVVDALKDEDPFALDLVNRAKSIINQCALNI